MTPFVDTLATLLDKFSVAMMTLVDDDARRRTWPMKTVRTGFNGHLWLRAENDPSIALEIGRGAEVSLAYGSLEAGQYVTVYGWAIAPGNSTYAHALASSVGRAPRGDSLQAMPLVCVTARAAQMWDVSADKSPRIFAFSHAQPSGMDAPCELIAAFVRPPARSRSSTFDVA